MSTIYLPGRGVVDLATRRIDAAVRGYDERLFAGRHPHNGLDTIFIKMPPGTAVFVSGDGLDIGGQRCQALMAFPQGFPETHEVLEKLAKSDATRRGTQILDEMNQANYRLQEPARRAAEEMAGLSAEVAESALHRLGKTRYSRSLPKRDPKQRNGGK